MNPTYRKHLEEERERLLNCLLDAEETQDQNLNQGLHEKHWYFGLKRKIGEKELDCVIFDDGNFAIDFSIAKKEFGEKAYNYIRENFGMNYKRGLLSLGKGWSKAGYKPFIMYKTLNNSGNSGISGSIGYVGFVLPEILTKKALTSKKNKLKNKNYPTPVPYPIFPQIPLTPCRQIPLNSTQIPLNSTKIMYTNFAFPKDLFDAILSLQAHYMDVHDVRVFKLTTSFILATYCFELFPAIGYLFFNSESGTGKTKFAEIIVQLSFNGVSGVLPSESVLFRIIEQTKCTFLIDDYEQLPDDRKEVINQILKVGYKKGGKVPRNEKRGDDFVPVFFDVFSPKIITNTTTLDPILLSRCIPVHLMKTTTNKGKLSPDFSSWEWQYLRDCCYNFVMAFWREILEAYNEVDVPELNNRDLELARPLLAVAKVCSDDYYQELKGFILDCFEQKNIIDVSTSWEFCCLRGIFNNVSIEQEWFSPKEICEWTKQELLNALGEEEFERNKKPSPHWIGKFLSKIPVFRKRSVSASTQYLLCRENVVKVMQSKGFPLPEHDEGVVIDREVVE